MRRKIMKNEYYHVCTHCGARLDPGERCDCRKAKAEARPDKKPTIKSERRKAI